MIITSETKISHFKLLPISLDVLLAKSNNLINRACERALSLCTGKKKLTFGEPLTHTNFLSLLKEVYNSINDLSLTFLQKFFIRKNTKNHRNYTEAVVRRCSVKR